MRTKLGFLAATSLVVVIALVSGSILVYFLAWLVAMTVAGGAPARPAWPRWTGGGRLA